MNIATSGTSIGTVNGSNESSNSNVPSQYKVLTLSFNQDCTYDLSINEMNNNVVYIVGQLRLEL